MDFDVDINRCILSLSFIIAFVQNECYINIIDDNNSNNNSNSNNNNNTNFLSS
jgi:hypothetical protein